jgi:membrane protein DedA with SNARE-associated domain
LITQVLNFAASFIISIISNLGYFGVGLAMAIESALVPLPSEIIMPFAGYLVFTGKFNLIFVAVAGAVGNLIGSLAAYALGYWGHERVVRRLVRKIGKFVLFTESDLDSSEKYFNRHGSWIVLVSRIMPAIRTYISLPAGIARYPIVKFSTLTFLGSLVWSFVLAYIGLLLGKNWDTLGPYFHKFDFIIVILGILFVAYYIYHKLKRTNVEKT